MFRASLEKIKTLEGDISALCNYFCSWCANVPTDTVLFFVFFRYYHVTHSLHETTTADMNECENAEWRSVPGGGEAGWSSGCCDRTSPAGGRGVIQGVGGDSSVSHCTLEGVTSPGWGDRDRDRQREGGGCGGCDDLSLRTWRKMRIRAASFFFMKHFQIMASR